jgi:hypothetical protein
MDAGSEHDPLGVGASDDLKLGLAVHPIATRRVALKPNITPLCPRRLISFYVIIGFIAR